MESVSLAKALLDFARRNWPSVESGSWKRVEGGSRYSNARKFRRQYKNCLWEIRIVCRFMRSSGCSSHFSEISVSEQIRRRSDLWGNLNEVDSMFFRWKNLFILRKLAYVRIVFTELDSLKLQNFLKRIFALGFVPIM